MKFSKHKIINFVKKKEMPDREEYILQKIRDIVYKTDPTAEIILYGSHARGTAKQYSDWDLLILLNGQNITLETEQKFRHNLYDIEIDTGEIISTYVVSKNDWETKYSITPLYASIKREGLHL